MIHWIAYSPLNVAAEKGMWKDLGVDVQVINFGSNQELNKSLEHRRIDIALDMIGSWVGLYMEGVPLTLIGETDWSYGGDKIIAKKSVDFNTLKDQTIGVYLNLPSVTFFLNKYLSGNGVRLSDINIIELEPEAMADNFIADRFKIIVNYDPQALRAEKKGNGVVVATSRSYPGVIPEGFVARKDQLAKIDRADLEKIFQGWVNAVKWVKNSSNWNEYKRILNAETFEGEDNYSDADLKGMIDAVAIHDIKTQLKRNRDGGGLQEYLVELHSFLKQNNMLKKEFNPGELFDNKAIVKVLSKN